MIPPVFLLVCTTLVSLVIASDPVIKLRDAASEVLDSPSIWAVYPASLSASSHIMHAVGELWKGIHSVGYWDESTANVPASWSSTGNTVLVFGGDDKQTPVTRLDLSAGTQTDQEIYQKMMEAMDNAMHRTLQGRGEKQNHQSHQQQTHQQQSKRKTKKDAVIKMDASNFDSLVMQNPAVVAVAFTAPWCGHCHRLEPEWREAAEILAKDDVVFGWVDATVETQLAAQYQVQGYPTIKIFPGGAKSKPYDYPAERSAAAIVEFLLEEVERSGVPKPVPELHLGPSQLQEACSGSNHLCVLAALPHILDSGATGRENYLQSLSKVARTFRKNFSFLWFEGGSAQADLEQALGLTFGFPALVAISLDRQGLAVMHGAFRETNVHTFLHGITTGRQPVLPLKVQGADLPVATTTPWDGKDGRPVEEEDDFDLEAFLNDEM
eukprot:scaffold846_cov168-Amphora_coffeaeformis.AAC.22